MRRSMRMAQQQGTVYHQLSLFGETDGDAVRHDPAWNGATEPTGSEEQQVRAAQSKGRAVAHNLMEQVCTRANLNRAYQRVRSNKGAPGSDGMTVSDLREWLATHKQALMASLLDGSYQPQPVKRGSNPRPGGGQRHLDPQAVDDRRVQQPTLQGRNPLLDPSSPPQSYGSRAGRSAHNAQPQARQYVAEGRTIVVDLDL